MKLEGIQKLVEDIWRATLGLDAFTVQGFTWDGTRSYIVWIRIIGSLNITIIFRCSETLARIAASVVFETEPEQVASDQVKDCLKELVNILGGHIKGMMASYHFLSTPSISEINQEPRFPEGEVVYEALFQSSGQPFKVSLLKVD